MGELSLRPTVYVSGSFDAIQTPDIRFLEEASKLGNVHLLLHSDKLHEEMSGEKPKFPQDERRYYLQSIRFVDSLTLVENSGPETVFFSERMENYDGPKPFWAVREETTRPDFEEVCRKNGFVYRVIHDETLQGFPMPPTVPNSKNPPPKKVAVSGCFDWVHSGHVRFFEEASAFGDLFVIVGHDANLRLLKGEGHPLFPEEERMYWVHSIRFVKQALVSSGDGWLDAAPEIMKIKPDFFVVNEDGDVPEKREFFRKHNITYRVLKRKPKPGLPARVSTNLRGF